MDWWTGLGRECHLEGYYDLECVDSDLYHSKVCIKVPGELLYLISRLVTTIKTRDLDQTTQTERVPTLTTSCSKTSVEPSTRTQVRCTVSAKPHYLLFRSRRHLYLQPMLELRRGCERDSSYHLRLIQRHRHRDNRHQGQGQAAEEAVLGHDSHL